MSEEPTIDSSRIEQLIEESEKTVGGEYRMVDPRDQAVLDEEDERLRKLALQSLIEAKKRKQPE